MKGITITLTQEQINDAHRVAKIRWEFARRAGIKDRQIDVCRQGTEIDVEGVKGEIAAGEELFGVKICKEPKVDDGIDYVIDGKTYDNKSTRHLNGKLLFKTKEAFKADRSLLTIVEDNLVHVVGYVTKENFLYFAEWTKLKAWTWALAQSRLVDINELFHLFTPKYRPAIETVKSFRGKTQLSLWG